MEIDILRGPSHVLYLLMYVGMPHCTVAVSVMVRAKEHVWVDICIRGGELVAVSYKRNHALEEGG